jgi:hypothetical protein
MHPSLPPSGSLVLRPLSNRWQSTRIGMALRPKMARFRAKSGSYSLEKDQTFIERFLQSKAGQFEFCAFAVAHADY